VKLALKVRHVYCKTRYGMCTVRQSSMCTVRQSSMCSASQSSMCSEGNFTLSLFAFWKGRRPFVRLFVDSLIRLFEFVCSSASASESE
jgi:hypothetical protein